MRTICYTLFVIICSEIRAETISYDDRTSPVTWRDFLKFVEDFYSQSHEEKRQYQDDSPAWITDREYDPRKSDRGVLFNSMKNDKAAEDFVYGELTGAKYDGLDDANPRPDVLNDVEYDDIAEALESEDGRQDLLTVALLEDMIDNAKQKSNQDEIQTESFQDRFSTNANDEVDSEGIKIIDNLPESSDELDSDETNGKVAEDTISSAEEDEGTSDGKKERGRSRDEPSEKIRGEIAAEQALTDEFGRAEPNDEDELRSLITELTKSKIAEDADVPPAKVKTGGEIHIDLRFPGISVNQDDTYLCTAAKIDDFTESYNKSVYITKYVPHAKETVAHHMLLYGCSSPGMTKAGAVWNCGGQMEGAKKGKFPISTLCGGGRSTILWAWAKNAKGFTLPKDIGFKVGSGTNVQYLVLQVHYKSASVFRGGLKDHSGVLISATKKPQEKLAGVYILASSMGTVQPHQRKNFDIACRYTQPFSIYPFAFRTHAHALGINVYGFRIRDEGWTLIGAKNPQLPEAFYPVATKNMTIRYGDWTIARCVMHNFRNVPTSIGWRHTDEMCNFYIMFWTQSKYEDQLDSWSKNCDNGFPWVHWSSLPGYST